MRELRIDRESGALVLANSQLGPSLGEGQFLNAERSATRIPRGGTRHFYELWEARGDLDVGLTLRFVPNGKLEQIHLKLMKQGTRGLPWSKLREDELKRFHDAWLKTQLGDSNATLGVQDHQFSWGRVVSLVEQPHIYSAKVLIDYTRNGRKRIALVALARAAGQFGLNSLGKRLRILALRR